MIIGGGVSLLLSRTMIVVFGSVASHSGAGSRLLIMAGVPFFIVNIVGGGTIVLLLGGSAKEIHA